MVDPNQERYEGIRKRWDTEDQLLMSRSAFFLTANSIFAAASQFQDDVEFNLGVAVLSLLISFLWLTTSWHSFNVIQCLYLEQEHLALPHQESIYVKVAVFVRPTTVFGKLLPSLLIVAWIVYFAWVGWEQYVWVRIGTVCIAIPFVIVVILSEIRTRSQKTYIKEEIERRSAENQELETE